MKKTIVLGGFLSIMIAGTAWCSVSPIHFDFESDTGGWAIPDWSLDQKDSVGKSVSISGDKFSSGASSLKLTCDFPGDYWASATVEYAKGLDLRGYKSISADVYLPKGVPDDLLAVKIIFTTNGLGQWIEMRDALPLKPGKWVTVKAPLEATPGGELEHWRCRSNERCIIAQLDKIIRVAIRIEYNVNSVHAGPPYKGDVYIDNVLIE
ncbi:MAG: hypothetical protein HQL28_05210 [Candidatus Omnitrophica bacterium]|nr:hypothetical protein [Candidatus Omnitrophota bacterium]